MRMKTLQQVLTFFYEKWKTKVKGFSKDNKNIELNKNKNQQFFDFPFDKVKPQQLLSWLDYSTQGWMILSSDLTIKFINKKVLYLIKVTKYKDIIGKAINDINDFDVVRNKIPVSYTHLTLPTTLSV